jgi:hypothetical protein
MEEGMQEPEIEGVATQNDLESYVVTCAGLGQAFTWASTIPGY